MRRILLATDSDEMTSVLTCLLRERSDGLAVERVDASGPLRADPIYVLQTTSPLLRAKAMNQRLFIIHESDSVDEVEASLRRLLDLLTNTRRVTPSRAEYGMHAAYGAALRSAALRGGVGAALVDDFGDVVALGSVEVPAYGGGQYWEGDANDARDIFLDADPATAARAATVERLLDLLVRMGVTLPGSSATVAGGLLTAFDGNQSSNGVGHGGIPAQTFESLGRVVHAEMAALMSAARMGLRTGGLTMYVTAQPCRQCLRHIVCAGLERVVYLGRRLDVAPPFHADSVAIGTTRVADKLLLVPFSGIGPGAYQTLFGAQMQNPPVAMNTLTSNRLENLTGLDEKVGK